MAVIFTDNFTGTVSTPLSTRTSSGGGAWQCFGATATDIAGLKIDAANKAKVASSNGCLARAELGVADHYAKATVFALTVAAAVAVRATDHLNFVGFRVYSATMVELFKRVAGVETSVIRVPVPALSVPVLLQLVFVGSTATLFVNGAQVGLTAGYSVADTGFVGVTKVGLWGKSSALDPIADDFEGGAAVTTLVVAPGRLGLTDGNALVGLAYILVPAGSKSTQTGRSAVVGAAPAFALAPTRGRSGLADRSVAVTWTAAVNPSGSALAQRARLAGLGLALAVEPTRAVHSERAGMVTLGSAKQIAPDGGRLSEHAGSGGLTLFAACTATQVPPDPRTTAVRHD